MALAVEAELDALFLEGQDAIALQATLNKMGHPKPATPIKTNNATSAGIVNKTIKQNKSKAMDMRLCWICNRSKQVQLLIFWRAGTENKANYFTKHHASLHHQSMQTTHIFDTEL